MRRKILHYDVCLGLAVVAGLALVAAFVLQYRYGMAPCHLCVLERWPYLAVVVAGIVGAALSRPYHALVPMTLVLAGATALAGYHVGVEQGWFTLPASCVAGSNAGSLEDLRAQLMAAAPTCDRATVLWLGLSLATWNAVLALLLTLAGLVGLFIREKPAVG